MILRAQVMIGPFGCLHARAIEAELRAPRRASNNRHTQQFLNAGDT
jgi:hypothetical protein